MSTRGTDAANDCLSSTAPCRTIAHALEQAASGDVIKLANGNYPTNVVIQDPIVVTIVGGFSGDFATQDPPDRKPRTRLTGHNQDRVFSLYADAETIDVTIERLLVKSGRGTTDVGGAGRHGGGILALARNGGELNLTLRNATLQQNKADLDRSGGAIGVDGSAGGSVDVVAEDTAFLGNSAERGGAIDVTGEGDSTVSLVRCIVKQNWARRRGGGVALERGDGGGSAALSVESGLFEKNGTAGDGGSIVLRGGVSASVVNTVLRKTRSGFGVITLDHLDGLTATLDVHSSTVTRKGASGGGRGLVL